MPHDSAPPPPDGEPGERPERNERGASLVEYALLVALIAVVLVGAVTMLGSATGERMSDSASTLSQAGPADS